MKEPADDAKWMLGSADASLIPDDWQEYTVKKNFRGTVYYICFKKGTEKGIYVDGVKSDSNIVYSENKTCNVTVIF